MKYALCMFATVFTGAADPVVFGTVDFLVEVNNPVTSCAIQSNGSDVYVGDASDPGCNGYAPGEVGIWSKPLHEVFWAMEWVVPEDEDPDDPDLIDVFIYATAEYRPHFISRRDLKPVLRILDYGATVNVRANLPGSGRARMRLTSPTPVDGGPQSLAPRLTMDLPPFRLGEEATIAVLHIGPDFNLPVQLCSVGCEVSAVYGGSMWGGYIERVAEPIPEPSTAALMSIGLAALLFGRHSHFASRVTRRWRAPRMSVCK